MIEIGINPNTQQASVAITMHGYFGLNKDGIKLVDQDKVFEQGTVRLAGEIPSNAFDTLQKSPSKLGENSVDTVRDNRGRFVQGNRISVGNNGGRPSKTPITDKIREVLEFKHYDKKDGTKIVANDLLAEALVDQAILRGNGKALDIIMERVEGKVTQSIKLSGAVAQGNLPEETLQKLDKLFKD